MSDELLLRQLLWLKHGCSFPSLYGDDGEMQCNSCMIDFKRDSADRILKRFEKIGRKKLKEEFPNGINFKDPRFREGD